MKLKTFKEYINESLNSKPYEFRVFTKADGDKYDFENEDDHYIFKPRRDLIVMAYAKQLGSASFEEENIRNAINVSDTYFKLKLKKAMSEYGKDVRPFDLQFAMMVNDGDEWISIFTTKDLKDNNITLDKKESLKILSTVLVIFDKIINTGKYPLLSFDANESSKIGLYKRFAKEMAKKYGYVLYDNGMYFLLVKKDLDDKAKAIIKKQS